MWLEIKETILRTRLGNKLRLLKRDLQLAFKVLFRKNRHGGALDVDRSPINREMNFVDYACMSRDVRTWSTQLPKDIDAIIGVPRSGILPAAMLALYMNKPLGEPYRFKESRELFAGGQRLKNRKSKPWAENDIKKVLVVDDSCLSGYALKKVKDLLNSIEDVKIEFAAVYPVENQVNALDYYCRIIPSPRVFEWNILHHSILEKSCCDIDGVLCRNPSEEENDDGAGYCQFIETVSPLYLPTVKVNTLVTCRLEKYRTKTITWLEKHGVEFEHLVMMNYSSMEERQQAKKHSEFKADVYLKSLCRLFIESSVEQAKAIYDLTKKPVLCIDEMKMYSRIK